MSFKKYYKIKNQNIYGVQEGVTMKATLPHIDSHKVLFKVMENINGSIELTKLIEVDEKDLEEVTRQEAYAAL